MAEGKNDVPDERPGEPGEAEREPGAEGEERAGAAPAERIAELEAEVADLKDKLLRALAEVENVRRRAEKEREDAAKYAIANFARDMLSVADNLRRALESIDAKTRAGDEAVENLAVGVEMTERLMMNAFERAGIKPIEALDRRFDHNLHEAMFELEDKEKPAGTVVQVMQTGYTLGDRLLRPAKVAVAKGGPKAGPKPGPEAGPEGGPEGSGGGPEGGRQAEPGEAAKEAEGEGQGGIQGGAQGQLAEPPAKGPAGAYAKKGDPAGSRLDEKT